MEAKGTTLISAGTEVVLNVGSLTFFGVVTDSRKTDQDGTTHQISVVDNRIKLMWDTVYCSFNNVEIVEDDVGTPGVDRKKWFWHIAPEDWDSQIKTYTESPLSGRQILQKAFDAETVLNGWTVNYHARLNKPVYQVDANAGKKLGTLLQEICEPCGVQVTLVGNATLEFSVPGEGTLPSPSSTNSTNRSYGEALGPDTKVRIVGDRNVYQCLSIDLEPDWVTHFEDYWFQPKWVERVKELWGVTEHGESEALAREVTIREYVEKTEAANSDYGIWGEVSRMEIPVWKYISDIVWKAYRVPRNFTINGIELISLDMREELLAAVNWNSAGILSYKEPKEFYPDTKGAVLVQGMPLSLFDPTTEDSIKLSVMESARTAWQPNNRFRLDTRNKVIIFEEATFIPGSGAQALYINPNVATPEAPQNIVVPNAGFVIQPARVRASLCFEAERFSLWKGFGVRQNSSYLAGLCEHVLLENGYFSMEVTYADNEGAQIKAREAADAFLTGQNIIESGGYVRHGTAGMALNGKISRVTATLFFSEGSEGEAISESIEYTKERTPGMFESDRELERRQKSKDLFPGQANLKEDAKNIRFISRLTKDLKRQSERPIENLDDVTRKVPGNVHCSPSYAYLDSNISYPVGMPVFVDSNLVVSSYGTRFAGVLTTHDTPAVMGSKIPLASQGVVPCRLEGPFNRGDIVGVDFGADFAKVGGTSIIGMAEGYYGGTEIIVGRVRLGSGTPVVYRPLFLKDVSEGAVKKIRVYYGTLAGEAPSGMTFGDMPPYVLTVTGSGVIWGGIYNDNESGVGVTARWIDKGDEKPVDTATEGYVEIGSWNIIGDVLYVANAATGSIAYQYCFGHYFGPAA